jgi:hypothetical protein
MKTANDFINIRNQLEENELLLADEQYAEEKVIIRKKFERKIMN